MSEHRKGCMCDDCIKQRVRERNENKEEPLTPYEIRRGEAIPKPKPKRFWPFNR